MTKKRSGQGSSCVYSFAMLFIFLVMTCLNAGHFPALGISGGDQYTNAGAMSLLECYGTCPTDDARDYCRIGCTYDGQGVCAPHATCESWCNRDADFMFGPGSYTFFYSSIFGWYGKAVMRQSGSYGLEQKDECLTACERRGYTTPTCTCTGGTAAVATDGSCETDGSEDCTACDTGYTLDWQVCNANVCTCTGGTAAVATDGSCETDGAEDCTACDAGYTLNGQECDTDTGGEETDTGGEEPAAPVVVVSMGLAGETVETFTEDKQVALVAGVEQVLADQGIEADVTIISINGVPVDNSGRRLLQDALEIELEITLPETVGGDTPSVVTIEDVADVIADDTFAETLVAAVEETSGVVMEVTAVTAAVVEPESDDSPPDGGVSGCSSLMPSVVTLGAAVAWSTLG